MAQHRAFLLPEISFVDNHAEIKILYGKHKDSIILIDAEDVKLVIGKFLNLRETQKPRRYVILRVGKESVKLHRFLLGLQSSNIVDHINRNPLDNRRVNLRICTHSQNAKNRSKNQTDTTSKYKGIYFNKAQQKYAARISVNKKRISLGCFVSEIEAAEAYNLAALKYFKEFASLNNIKKGI